MQEKALDLGKFVDHQNLSSYGNEIFRPPAQGDPRRSARKIA